MEHVEYRRADTDEDKEAIFRMRYEAYMREGNIEPDSSERFADPSDEKPNVWLVGVYIDGALASSIRLHIASKPEHYLPDTAPFSDKIGRWLEDGVVLVDATRQTSRLEFTRAYPFLPLVTMRCGFLAMEYFGADYLLGTCRAEYQAAFRRLFGSKTVSDLRPYPPLKRPNVLMAYDCKAQWAETRQRYPFLTSSVEERKAMFGRSSNVGYDLNAQLTSGRRELASAERHNSTTYVA